MGADKIEWALEQRRVLLEHVKAGKIDCDLYSKRLIGALRVAARAVEACHMNTAIGFYVRIRFANVLVPK